MRTALYPTGPNSFKAIPGVASMLLEGAVPPLSTTVIDSHRLPCEGPHLNGSIAEWGGELHLAYRAGMENGRIWHTNLIGFQPGAGHRCLELPGEHGARGQDDPRLFTWRDRLCVAYSGYSAGKCANVCVAELDDTLHVARNWLPEYAGRKTWEKNWGFFDVEGVLHCVYSISPHVVLRFSGETATEVARVDWRSPYCGGEMRGGASPVRVGDVYYSFFHGRICVPNEWPRYTLGVYTFSAVPPFAPLQCAAWPLMWSSDEDRPAGYAVVYPCGAVLRGDSWLISAGWQDREVRLFEYSTGAIDSCLQITGSMCS
jgi:predicted GH43/DUF377 family glycosyl hydrolase